MLTVVCQPSALAQRIATPRSREPGSREAAAAMTLPPRLPLQACGCPKTGRAWLVPRCGCGCRGWLFGLVDFDNEKSTDHACLVQTESIREHDTGRPLISKRAARAASAPPASRRSREAGRPTRRVAEVQVQSARGPREGSDGRPPIGGLDPPRASPPPKLDLDEGQLQPGRKGLRYYESATESLYVS